METVVASLKAAVEIKDRKHGIPSKTYTNCFVGKEAVTALVNAGLANNRADAVRLGDILLNAGVFQHVLKEHGFEDGKLFYRFKEDQLHGETEKDFAGNPVSWADFLSPFQSDPTGESLQPQIPESDPNLAEFSQAVSQGVEPLAQRTPARQYPSTLLGRPRARWTL